MPEGARVDPNVARESRAPERTNTSALSSEEKRLLNEMSNKDNFYDKLNIVGKARVGPGEVWQDVNAKSSEEDVKRAYAMAGAFANRASAIGGEMSGAANEEFMEMNKAMNDYKKGKRNFDKPKAEQSNTEQPRRPTRTYYGEDNRWTMHGWEDEFFGKSKDEGVYSNKEIGDSMFTKLFWKTLGGERIVQNTIGEYDKVLDEKGILGKLYGEDEVAKYRQSLKEGYEKKLKMASGYGLFLPAEIRGDAFMKVAETVIDYDLSLDKMVAQIANKANEQGTGALSVEGKDEREDLTVIQAVLILWSLGALKPTAVNWTESQRRMIEETGAEVLNESAQTHIKTVRGKRD